MTIKDQYDSPIFEFTSEDPGIMSSKELKKEEFTRDVRDIVLDKYMVKIHFEIDCDTITSTMPTSPENEVENNKISEEIMKSMLKTYMEFDKQIKDQLAETYLDSCLSIDSIRKAISLVDWEKDETKDKFRLSPGYLELRKLALFEGEIDMQPHYIKDIY